MAIGDEVNTVDEVAEDVVGVLHALTSRKHTSLHWSPSHGVVVPNFPPVQSPLLVLQHQRTANRSSYVAAFAFMS